MQLIMSPTSPYARKALIVLREKMLPCEVVMDPPWNAGSGVPQMNPLGKIPVLRLDDGTVLYDSSVIVQYAELICPQPAVLPAEPLQRVQALRWEALADGMIDAAVALVKDRIVPAVSNRLAVDVMTFGDEVRSVTLDQLATITGGTFTDVRREG